jgi:hypothetical protein
MTPRVRVLLLLVAVVSAAGCAAPREETWIGSNVGVTVDSSAAKTATPETR